VSDPEILGVRISPLNSSDLIATTVRSVRERQKEVILPVNAHFLNLAAREAWLRDFANSEGVHVVADGKGVLLAARALRLHIPEHIRFVEWVHLLFARADKEGMSIFFLGGDAATVRQAEEEVKRERPGLKIVGAHTGYFDHQGPVSQEVVRRINDCSPDILLVGMSMPVDERWALENRHRLNVGAIVLGAGCFEWLSGKTTVAPRWLTELHLEWLFRLIQEPGRLWKRYILGNPLFILRILKERYHRAK
jgi:N-acetylglucosaminyldiphosphoundecaprenol N-acetyl-beta-D-mannosaminyltransferase